MTSEHHIVVPRRARYHLVGEPGPGIEDVWFVLHGYGQLAATFARHFARVASPARLIVAPEALSRFYLDPLEKRIGTPGRVGATWMTREDREAEIADQIDYLDALAAHVRAATRDDARVLVLGFSQGTATAVRWVMNGAMRPHRLVIWAGGIPPEADLAAHRDRLGEAPVTLVAGDRDPYAPAPAVAAMRARLDAAGVPHQLLTFAGAHTLDGGVVEELATGDG